LNLDDTPTPLPIRRIEFETVPEEDGPQLPLDVLPPGRVRVRPLSERQNKVDVADFPRVENVDVSAIRGLEALFPRILAGREFPEFLDAVAVAIRANKPVIMMLGGHVVKTGLSYLIVDLLRRGYITHLAANGSVAIHDWELALQGATSEDVGPYLDDGRFGLWEETGGGMSRALASGMDRGYGYGEALGRWIVQHDAFLHRNASIMATCAALDRPMTIHSAFGAEIIHEHPAADGAVHGTLVQRDFHRLTHRLASLEGGVVMNWGSAVMMPEVFLKALAIARNKAAQGHTGWECESFTNASFDFIKQYRPLVNVVQRPSRQGGKGYVFTGHHELIFPMFYAGLRARLG